MYSQGAIALCTWGMTMAPPQPPSTVFLRGRLQCVTSDRVGITVGSALQGLFYVLFDFGSLNEWNEWSVDRLLINAVGLNAHLNVHLQCAAIYQGTMGNHHVTFSCRQVCCCQAPLQSSPFPSGLEGSIAEVVFIIEVCAEECVRGERHCLKQRSNVQICSLYGKWAVIANSARLKTAFCVSSPSILPFFQSPFQPQPKNKQFPSIILHPIYISPAASFYWLDLPDLLTLRRSKWNSPTQCRAWGRLTPTHSSLLLQLGCAFTRTRLISNRKKNLSPKVTRRKCLQMDVWLQGFYRGPRSAELRKPE